MTVRWPRSWVGTWRADDGKTVTVERRWGSVLVTVRPSADAGPYVTATLLDGSRKTVRRLPGLAELDQEGRLRLSVEAGTEGSGPCYHLYPTVCRADGARARPAGDEPPRSLELVPDVMFGLYDDWEDDLGAPWAFPLSVLCWRANS